MVVKLILSTILSAYLTVVVYELLGPIGIINGCFNAGCEETSSWVFGIEVPDRPPESRRGDCTTAAAIVNVGNVRWQCGRARNDSGNAFVVSSTYCGSE